MRELEADGVIVRTVSAETPSRVEYELTALGHSLTPILATLHEWGARHRPGPLPSGTPDQH
ncbi:winged helix-turn-helix transcriptional regulator [Devosia sp. 1635]|uniref:winged helix-turn-helix transcriptional regulator n=1 Tax=Devosia sp. 1635 TaxID=2726066 RepID=UPI0032C0C28E